MSTITFDTLQFTERLRSAGVSEAQAKAEAEALRDALSQALDTTMASKIDIQEVRADIAKLDKELSILKWMVGMVMAGVAAQVIKTFFG